MDLIRSKNASSHLQNEEKNRGGQQKMDAHYPQGARTLSRNIDKEIFADA